MRWVVKDIENTIGWTRWFAWYPVQLMAGIYRDVPFRHVMVWLEFVDREVAQNGLHHIYREPL